MRKSVELIGNRDEWTVTEPLLIASMIFWSERCADSGHGGVELEDDEPMSKPETLDEVPVIPSELGDILR